MPGFDKRYFFLALLLFSAEVAIALFVRDSFVRPFLGDVLVVLLIYAFVKAFFNFDSFATALGVLAFAFVIEFCQYLNLVERLNLQDIAVARVVLGTSFSWLDMICYVAGFLTIITVERFHTREKKQ